MNKMMSVIYGIMLVMLIGAAYLVAAGVLQPDHMGMVATLAAVSFTAFIAEIASRNTKKNSDSDFAAA